MPARPPTREKVYPPTFLFCLLLFLLPFPVLGAGVVINEVMFDPAASDTGLEWVEVYNAGDAPADLSGWQLYPDGIGYFTFPQGFTLGVKQFAVVHLRTSGTNSATDLYHASASGNMGNTSGSVALFSKEPRGKDTMQSFAQWGRSGETWERDGADAVLWTKGTFVDISGFAEGKSIGLAADGVASGGAGAWRIMPSPTPGAGIGGSAVSGSAPAPTSSSPQASASAGAAVSSPTVILPSVTLRADAGSDTTVAAGSLIEFVGAAAIDGKLLTEGVRFWWNFGDGGSREGRVVSHTFTIPGVYTVGFHVSNTIYAASDYLTVTVLPGAVSLPRVVAGEAGFVVIRNGASAPLDVGEWILEDGAGKRFIIPSRTKIAAGAETAFPNAVSGLLALASSTPFAALAYPNGVRAAVSEHHPIAAPVAPPPPIVGEEGKKAVPFLVVSGVTQESSSHQSVGQIAGVAQNNDNDNDMDNDNSRRSTSSLSWSSLLLSSWSPSLFLAAAAFISVCGALGFLFVRSRM